MSASQEQDTCNRRYGSFYLNSSNRCQSAFSEPHHDAERQKLGGKQNVGFQIRTEPKRT